MFGSGADWLREREVRSNQCDWDGWSGELKPAGPDSAAFFRVFVVSAVGLQLAEPKCGRLTSQRFDMHDISEDYHRVSSSRDGDGVIHVSTPDRRTQTWLAPFALPADEVCRERSSAA